jgi:tRNA pseudouridine38-40 synthase
MRNIKLVIQYDGTAYHGWQIQPEVVTVQEVLLDRLAKVIGERVKLSASARTDSGVHARCQVVNFKTDSLILPGRLILALNGLLPDDIVVAKASDLPDSFNARHSARSREYRYSILNRRFRSPFDLGHCYFVSYPVDVDAMKEGAGFLLGTHDFTSFESHSGKRDNPVRTVEKLNLFSRAGFIRLDIRANGFLTHMVRIVAGTLLDVGRGKILPEDIREILKARERQRAGPTLPAKGLCLMKVIY